MADQTEQRITDRIDPARAGAWLAAFGHPDALEVGQVLPPFAHHAYFWDPKNEENLGLDGHP